MLSSRPVQLPADGAYFPTKTPGRALKNRAENAHAGAATINGKLGKHATAATAFPKTPFQASAAKPGKQRIQLTTARPLGDKTPLPNRFAHALFQTTLDGATKLSKLVPHRDGAGEGGSGAGTPDSAQRPSSMRKHPKHPRNSGRFETPVNSGRHWDVSDGEIAVPEAVQQATIVEDAGDLDELEYGHANTLDLPYRPPFDFDLPDYVQVGRTLRGLAHAPRYDEMLVPDFEMARLDSPTWDSMPLPELESDDPFYLARKELSALALPKAKTENQLAKNPRAFSTTRAPRVAASRSAPRIAPSDSATSTHSNPNPAALTRPGAAARRLPTPSATTATRPLPAAKAKAPLTSTAKNVTSTRPGASSVAGHVGPKAPVLKKVLSGRVGEVRRPHTSIAVMRAKPKPLVDDADGIVFADAGLEIGGGEEFLFDV
ncbi:hypothetical protein HYPSUDRAFT_69995 [Hypholoma sublateritium FD-334 SS-4]|uniref:Uncharacterized protein n=1 Tax=Hypholoma sublateritium (strain FD-334 SS-4) TaxID=945553 RepID=A0A0D2PDP7_HYPSF|nr:hypothetical protein HYPSUDRAFT_69995 [Hypholoma sublateritium FD-334 SS-4]